MLLIHNLLYIGGFKTIVSVSSKSEIIKRVKSFLQENFNFEIFDNSQLKLLKEYLNKEYDTIPEKERIGKGMVYIIKIVAKVLYNHIKDNNFNLTKQDAPNKEFISAILKFIDKIEAEPAILQLAIHVTANLALDSFESTIEKIEKWALHEKWEIQENACYPIRNGLKKHKNLTINKLKEWAQYKDEKLRRLVSESLRPMADIKWLRDPSRNDVVLEILTLLNHDMSIYVRKSVGNNLKDLTKYMPTKILDLIEKWIASEENLDRKDKKNLIWTIYHALRWLKAKKHEYHERIKKIIGENYILYYDEKKNRRALPLRK